MNQLEQLWELQKHDRILTQLKERLQILNKEEEIEKLRISVKQREYDLANKKTQLDVDDMKIKRFEQKLRQLNFDIKEIDEKLYSGKINNLKQLEQLEKESAMLKKEAKRVETDTIELMEEMEKLEGEITEVEELFLQLKKRLKEEEDNHDKLVDSIEEKIKEEEESIQSIKEKIDDDLVKKYEYLKEKKGKVIVEVSGDKCTGCHMAIPLSLLSKIKRNNTITYCDNCGRILYYIKEKD